MGLPVQTNFTIVIIVLVKSTTYADQRITGPAIEIAVDKIRKKYPALGDFRVITWTDAFLASCDSLEANVVSKAAGLYYPKLTSSHPISAFFGTTCTFGNQQFLDPLFSYFTIINDQTVISMLPVRISAIFILLILISVQWANSNFTIVIIVLVRSTTYADQRITGPAMEIAVEKVRIKYPSLGKFQVVTWKDAFMDNCDSTEANVVNSAAKLYYEKLNSSHPVAAFFGTTCTFANRQFLDPLFYWNLPLLEGSSIPSFIADRKRYPMIIGYSYTQRRAGEFFYQIMRTFGWTNVVGMHDIEDPVWRAMFTAMDYLRGQPDISLETAPFYLKSKGRWDVSRALGEANQNARVFLILAGPGTIRDIMFSAHKCGFAQGDHVFIAGDYFKTKFYFGLPEWQDGSADQEVVRHAFQSLFLVKQHVPTSPEFQEFSSRVQELAIREYNQSIPPYDEVNTHAIGFHDAIYSYGQVANEAINEGADIFDGRSMIRRFTNRTFSGIRGNFTLDSDNNLKGHFELWSFQYRSGDFVKALDFSEMAEVAEIVSDVQWLTPDGKPPPNGPVCGFLGNDPACRDHTVQNVVGPVIAGMILVVAVGFGVYSLGQRRRLRQFEETNTKWWDVRSNDVVVSVGRDESDFANPATSIFKHEMVNLIPITASILTDDAVLELKMIRKVPCDNLLRIVGLCLDQRIMITEFCARGSLYHFIRSGNNDFSMLHDWIFRFSIISDLIQGLDFLHNSHIRQHGRLKSTSCYLTFRFVLKIGDYCLQSLTPGHTVDLNRSIWSAPEILRGSLLSGNLHAQRAADIFSFAIIVSEVCWFGDPFALSGYSMDPAEIVQAVREIRKDPVRPRLDILEGHGPQMNTLKSLIAECWHEMPSKRPSSSTILKHLHSLIGDEKDGLVEELLTRVAGHAEGLEKLVSERTRELNAEKGKIQSLLFEILPRSVALDLINGRAMVPEEYQSVTVLFSAVQGFAALATVCSPTQLMGMMHVLYTTIDAGIDRFDVYKVETVIDQYMIASGVPVRNGNDHVAQIAACALYLRKAATKISWPLDLSTNPEDDLPYSVKFLIGFHTGKIMTGVIGTKMPRFCLFGDTINTASRMESTAPGGRIQFSEASKTILVKSNQFLYEPRGEIAIKGKGLMNTYFLLDHLPLVTLEDRLRNFGLWGANN